MVVVDGDHDSQDSERQGHESNCEEMYEGDASEEENGEGGGLEEILWPPELLHIVNNYETGVVRMRRQKEEALGNSNKGTATAYTAALEKLSGIVASTRQPPLIGPAVLAGIAPVAAAYQAALAC